MNPTLDQFMAKFAFNPARELAIGIERERFITNQDGRLLPAAHQVLQTIAEGQHFKPELSACQIEDVTDPIPNFRDETAQSLSIILSLAHNDRLLWFALDQLQLGLAVMTVAPPDMPYDIYPDPRYQSIAAALPTDVMQTACRLTGTHIHIGMRHHDHALAVYNRVIRHLPRLCAMSAPANEDRLALYHQVAPYCEPPAYRSWSDYHQRALRDNFAADPRLCWDLIRLSVHGTIEFRLFPAVNKLEKIAAWAINCQQLCRD